MASQQGLELTQHAGGFTLTFQQRVLIQHSAAAPCLWIGRGKADIEMFRGNFSIKDQLSEKLALTETQIVPQGKGWLILFSRGDVAQCTLAITTDAQGRLEMQLRNSDEQNNRMWLRLAAQQLGVQLLVAALHAVHQGLQAADHFGQGACLHLQRPVSFLPLVCQRKWSEHVGDAAVQQPARVHPLAPAQG